jgi:hypothetical protein
VTLSGNDSRTNRRSSRTRVAGWFCALSLVFIPAQVASAQQWLPIPGQQGLLPSAGREPAGHLVSKTAHPSVARIVVQEKTGVSYGTGSLIDVRGEYGLLVTNWHVVRDSAGGSIYAFFPDGFQTPATIVKADKDWDLAALSIRKPPNAQPLRISQTAPRTGEWLCIAGYGSGDYRAAAGRVTQYVSPATNLPYEMVELAAEARQGDSGGPIFNERLELAGVLFGSANGTTSGSYSGRVLNFLHGVVPTNVPAGPGAVAQPVSQSTDANLAQQLPAAPTPAADAHLFAAAPPTSNNGLLPYGPPAPEVAGNSPPLSIDTVAPVSDRALAAARALANAPAASAEPRPLMPLPARNPQPLTLVNGEEPLADDRTALRPAPNRRLDALDGRDLDIAPAQGGPVAADALNVTHTPLPPRLPTTGSPLEATPADQLIAAAWKQIGGTTIFDQGKTLLAVLGLLGLLIQFWRLNSRPDPVGDDD